MRGSSMATPTPATSLPNSNRSIPSLDGLRALSIGLVLLSHAAWFLPRWLADSSLFRYVIGIGSHGVAIFFVISGYLITTILLKEERSTATISLKRFYFRRTMRIFPPYYVFLGAIGLMWTLHKISLSWPNFLAAATYSWALYPQDGGSVITHCWSLSIEELFYLVWPITFMLSHGKNRPLIVLAGILFAPVLRIGLYFLVPAFRGHEIYMVQGWVDTMLFGCLLALLRTYSSFEAWHATHLYGWIVFSLAVIAFYLMPLSQAHLAKPLSALISETLGPFLIALSASLIVLYVVTRTEGLLGRFLNNGALKHIGVLSYSLYLWQQPFLIQGGFRLGYVGFLYTFLLAESSFWLVERPTMALRSHLKFKN